MILEKITKRSVAALAVLFACSVLAGNSFAAKGSYTFDDKGNLVMPENYRTWIYVGTPITPNDMNPPKAAFPDFHNVYIHPDAFAHYQKTGEFMDGTILVKELVTVGSKQAVSGNGFFQGEFYGLEAAVKDEKQFPVEPGNWAYFSFGHSYPLSKTAKAFPTESCNSCHENSPGTEDFVFTQYYPVLRAAKAEMIMNSGGMVPANKEELFSYLQKGKYKNFARESKMHRSSGPHDDVITFMNPILDASMKAGNSEHPLNSASVKELYKNGKLYGWAVMVKVDMNASSKGKRWYWYEVVSPTNPKEIFAEGIGHPKCAGCHSPGRDMVRTRYPLK